MTAGDSILTPIPDSFQQGSDTIEFSVFGSRLRMLQIKIPEEIMERSASVTMTGSQREGLGFEIRDMDDSESMPIFKHIFNPKVTDIEIAISITGSVCLYIEAWKIVNE